VSGTPKQVAVIPYRRVGDDLTVCLIRRKHAESWGIPKGFIDPGDTPEEAALTEAFEEAGLLGELTGAAIGSYDYTKRGVPFTVAVYLMQVLEDQEEWQEMRFRDRAWYSMNEAARRLADHPVWPLWDRAKARLEGPSR
jgi:8-oxo-dGTP pyrophosphatase MutT (NUDIX family)